MLCTKSGLKLFQGKLVFPGVIGSNIGKEEPHRLAVKDRHFYAMLHDNGVCIVWVLGSVGWRIRRHSEGMDL